MTNGSADAAWLTEEIEGTDDIRRSFATGLFTGTWADTEGVRHSIAPRSLADALQWARGLSPWVVVRVRGDVHYSAGSQPVGDAPELPEGLQLEPEWLWVDGMDWLDRTLEDDPIEWEVGALLQPWPPSTISSAMDRAIAEGAVPEIEESGSVSHNRYRLRLRVDARTDDDAWDLLTPIVKPLVEHALTLMDARVKFVQVNMSARPSGVVAPDVPRRERGFSVKAHHGNAGNWPGTG